MMLELTWNFNHHRRNLISADSEKQDERERNGENISNSAQ
jgi:hypothetical protein